FFAKVCDSWRVQEEKLRNAGHTDAAVTLAFRISGYDINNYRLYEAKDGQRYLIHQPPPTIQEIIDSEREEIQLNQLKLTFPFRCHNILRDKEALSTEAEIEAFWTEAQKV